MSHKPTSFALAGAGFLPILAVWSAVLAAGLELGSLLLRRFGMDQLLFVGGNVWWSVPLVDLVLFLLLATGLLIGRLIWKTGPWWQVGLWLFAFLAVIGLLYSFPGIHRLAVLLLGAGVATQAVRWAAHRPERFHRLVLRTAPWLLAIVVVGAGVIRIRESAREKSALGALPPPTSGAPNVLLIVLDTARAIDLSLYGYHRETTPELSQWAQRGVVYRWAFSTAPWTLPSHASIFTGRLVHEMTADWMVPLDGSFPTLAEILASRGYATGGFSANTDYVSAEVGLARGFAHFDDYSLTPGLILRSSALGRALGRNQLLRRIIRNDRMLGRKDAPHISSTFLRWIDGRKGRPWFAFLNYYDAHRPYQPPAPYYGMFASGDIRPDPRFRQDDDPENPWTPADARNFTAAYDGAIRYLDGELARLFAELERRGELDRTLVILTSDHGEEFGEHGLYDHGHSLYQASLHVPLLLWLPGGARAGSVIEEAVSLRDIPATVLEFAGGESGSPFPGRSLARFWGIVPAVPDTVVSGVKQVARQPEWFPASRGDLIALAADSLRYIRNLGDGSEELYNYVGDPWERVALDSTESGQAAAERFRRRTGLLLGDGARGRAAP